MHQQLFRLQSHQHQECLLHQVVAHLQLLAEVPLPHQAEASHLRLVEEYQLLQVEVTSQLLRVEAPHPLPVVEFLLPLVAETSQLPQVVVRLRHPDVAFLLPLAVEMFQLPLVEVPHLLQAGVMSQLHRAVDLLLLLEEAFQLLLVVALHLPLVEDHLQLLAGDLHHHPDGGRPHLQDKESHPHLVEVRLLPQVVALLQLLVEDLHLHPEEDLLHHLEEVHLLLLEEVHPPQVPEVPQAHPAADLQVEALQVEVPPVEAPEVPQVVVVPALDAPKDLNLPNL